MGYQLPPAPCRECPYGPSSICQRGVYLEPNSGGCMEWSVWFRANWPKVTAALRGGGCPPEGEEAQNDEGRSD